MRTYKNSNPGNIYWLTLFLVKRLLIAAITIWLKMFPWLQICLFQYVQLFIMGHFVNYFPMDSSALNKIECFNEMFVLFHGYFLLLFTDLIPDVDTRYDLGNVQMYILLTVVGIDFMIIIYIMVVRILRQIRLNREKARLR